MSWPGEGSQPQQARLTQALHDFGDATDQAVRAWAGELTVQQALDIPYVLTDILRLLGTTAERLSRYRAGSEPAAASRRQISRRAARSESPNLCERHGPG